MTDRQRTRLAVSQALEQGQIAGLFRVWRSWRRGTRLRCVDDSHGANLLRRGEVYTVDAVQWDDDGDGWPRVFVGGVAIGFLPTKFEFA